MGIIMNKLQKENQKTEGIVLLRRVFPLGLLLNLLTLLLLLL